MLLMIVIASLSFMIEAMQKRDSDLAEEAVAHDRLIDDLHAEVDEMAIRLLALRQPMAGDLRHIVTTLKVAPRKDDCRAVLRQNVKRK